MKKYLSGLTAIALLLASCSNDEDLSIAVESSGNAIEFRSLNDEKTSLRSVVANENNITSFTVTAWWDKTKTFDAGTASTNYGDTDPDIGTYLFNAFNIARGDASASGGAWDYSPKRYWPADGKGMVDFYAYSPASSPNLSTGLADFEPQAPTNSVLTYTVPHINNATLNPNNLPQEDFLVAKVLEQNSGTVNLNFQHALSRVKFFARKTNNNITYVVEKVELVNLDSIGTLDLTDTAIPQTGNFTYPATPLTIWKTMPAAKTTYAVDMGKSPVYLTYNNDATPTGSSYSSILGETNAMMVLPQATTEATAGLVAPSDGEFAIAVTYKAYLGNFYYAGSATQGLTRYFSVKDPVTGRATDPITFEIGRQYNFYLTFGSEVGDAVKFDVAVSDWSDVEIYPIETYATVANFPDDDFRDYINSTFAGTDGILSHADLLAIPDITVPATVTDLTGIQLMLNLAKITFTGTALPTTIPVHKSVTEIEIGSANLGWDGAIIGSPGATTVSNLAKLENLQKVTIRSTSSKEYDFNENFKINDITVAGNGGEKVNIGGDVAFSNLINPPTLNPTLNPGQVSFYSTGGYCFLFVDRIGIATYGGGSINSGTGTTTWQP